MGQGEQEGKRLDNGVHLASGTGWGCPERADERSRDIRWQGSAAHFGLLWGAGMTMLSALGLASAPWKWGAGELAKDGGFH